MEIMCQERIMSKGLEEERRKKYIELFMLGWITNPIRDNKFIRRIRMKENFIQLFWLVLGTDMYIIHFFLYLS